MGTFVELNTPRYRGRYELDLERSPSALEWSWIKKISGYLPLTFDEGLRGGDPTLVIALAAITLYRAGRVPKDDILRAAELLSEVPFDGTTITIVGDDEEDADPPAPAEAPATVQPLRSTGGSSSSTSDRQEVDLSRTGALS